MPPAREVPPGGEGNRRLAQTLLVAAALAAFLWPVLSNGFVSFDDGQYVFDNAVVQRGLTWAGARWAFGTFHGANWHPLTWLSHMLDVQLFGLAPAGHHAVGLALHAANALLLQRVLWAYTGALWPGTVVALLFALHPLRVESFAWAAERKDLLAGLFWMLALLAYRRHAAAPAARRYAAAVALFAAGLMAKPMLVVLPAVLVVLDFWPLGRLQAAARRGGAGLAPLLLEKLPLFALALAGAAVTLLAQQSGDTLAVYTLGERLANAAVSAVAYLGKTLWPSGLVVYYPFRTHVPGWQLAGALGCLILLTLAAWARRRREPWLLAGWLWYAASLTPVIGVLQVGDQAMADRYTYLPLIGPVIALVWALAGAAPGATSARRWLAAATTAVVVLLGVLSARQVGFWRDSETLFTRALLLTEDNWVANEHLGVVRASQGRREEAERHYRETIRLNPYRAEPYNNLGNLLIGEGRAAEALPLFGTALRERGEDPVILYNFAIALAAVGRTGEARAAYARVLAREPGNHYAHTNLGILLLGEGNLAGAREHFGATVRLAPDNAAGHVNLGIALERGGDLRAARDAYRRALELEPGNAAAARGFARAGG